MLHSLRQFDLQRDCTYAPVTLGWEDGDANAICQTIIYETKTVPTTITETCTVTVPTTVTVKVPTTVIVKVPTTVGVTVGVPTTVNKPTTIKATTTYTTTYTTVCFRNYHSSPEYTLTVLFTVLSCHNN